jgi:hypothetical protein
MRHTRLLSFALAAAVVAPSAAVAQTTTAPGIDVEVYNPVTGDNQFCVAPGTPFWANVFVRPGASATSCILPCSADPLSGGTANLAAAVIDLAFDPARITYYQAESNPDPLFAAVDGMAQVQNLAQGRIGWALAGDFTPDGDPGGTISSPCDTGQLAQPGWVYRVELSGVAEGMTTLRLRREGDPTPFPLSFADICGSPAFTEGNGSVDEVRSAEVMVSNDCGGAGVVFFDGMENGDLSQWSLVMP